MSSTFCKPALFTLALMLVATSAAAAPPSSRLTGDEGVLSWTVAEAGGQVVVDGSSPKWTVHHEATASMTPRKTVRYDADGRKVTVVYGADSVTVTMPSKTVTHDRGDLWDADTLDVRLGHIVSQGGSTDISFDALDPSSGKVYRFDAKTQGSESCGAATCRRVLVRLGGMLKLVGPKWEFWFAPSGQLMRFAGPIGDYASEGVAR